MISFKIKKNRAIIYSAMLVIIVGAVVLPNVIEVGVIFLFLAVYSILCIKAYQTHSEESIADMLTFPAVLSAFQNLYLGLIANYLVELELQILLSINFAVFICVFFSILYVTNTLQNNKWCIFILVVISVQSLMLYFFSAVGMVGFLSSFRNILSCIVIYWVACTLGERCDEDKFFRNINCLAVFVIAIGIVEESIGNKFWQDLNIGRLWNLKGIETRIDGTPLNWYSSEKIAGNQMRRMVSSFADPVNLGTYLFAAFMGAWYKKKRIICFFLVVCSILTISKGALIGFLVFAVIYAWYKDKSKISIPFIIASVFAVCMYFLYFSKTSSTGSLFLHVSGFFNSLWLLFEKPLGNGVGSVGVLARIFSQNYVEGTGVTESGMGMLIAQLGLPGLLIYIYFYYKIFTVASKWDCTEKNDKILFYSLLFSFILNATFNEVALSPNSCVLYFLILGILTAKNKRKGCSA